MGSGARPSAQGLLAGPRGLQPLERAGPLGGGSGGSRGRSGVAGAALGRVLAGRPSDLTGCKGADAPQNPLPHGLLCGGAWAARCWAAGVREDRRRRTAGWAGAALVTAPSVARSAARWRVRVHRQTDAGIRTLPVGPLFFFFKRQLLPREKSQICTQMVIRFFWNFIRGSCWPSSPLSLLSFSFSGRCPRASEIR